MNFLCRAHWDFSASLVAGQEEAWSCLDLLAVSEVADSKQFLRSCQHPAGSVCDQA